MGQAKLQFLSRAEQSRAEQSRAEQSRAEQSRAEQTVTVEDVTKNTYGVTLTAGTGYTLTAKDSTSPVAHGGGYTFAFALTEGYSNSSYKVKVNDKEVELTNGEYTISDIKAAQTVTVEDITKNTYGVKLTSGTGYILTAEDSSNPVTHGESFTFAFALTDDYTNSDYTVKVNDNKVKLTNDGEYTISDIKAEQIVTVEGVTKNTYAVTYNLQGHGTAIPQSTGSMINKPDVPTAPGYTFDGWYKDSDCTSAWDFSSDTVTEPTTLYAKWRSSDAGVTSVSVANKAGTIGETTIHVVLPYGTEIPTDPSKVSITPVAGATVSGLAMADEGATWTFTVTSEDENTTEDYTIKVSVASRPADTGGGSGSGYTYYTEPDGTKVTVKTETKSDGTKVETKTEEKPDGTQIKTVTETQPDGTQIKTVTETKPDGSKIETTSNEKSDGSKTETTTEKNASGDTTKTVTTTTTAQGDETVKTTLPDAGSGANVVVTVKKDPEGTVTSTQATITQPGTKNDDGTKTILRASVIKQVIAITGSSNPDLWVKIIVVNGTVKYTVYVKAKDFTANKKLYLYTYNRKTGPVNMVNSKIYQVSAKGNLSINVAKKNTYVLLNSTDRAKIRNTILKTVKLATATKKVSAGKKTTIAMNKKLDKNNVKTITYTSGNKKKATVSKTGVVQTKKNVKGTVTVKVKVTLKDGTVKTLNQKIVIK